MSIQAYVSFDGLRHEHSVRDLAFVSAGIYCGADDNGGSEIGRKALQSASGHDERKLFCDTSIDKQGMWLGKRRSL
jgi:hypothetical protein